jgi:hypothetical protein
MLDDAAGLDEIDPSIDEDEDGQEDAGAEPLSTQEEGQVGRQSAPFGPALGGSLAV